MSSTYFPNVLFKRMADVEIVVRFFAFRDVAEISGSVRGMLDATTKKYRFATESELNLLRQDFEGALRLCVNVFGAEAFRLPTSDGKTRLSRPLFDAEMVSMHQLRERRVSIIEKADEVKLAVMGLAMAGAETYELMVGRANTSSSIKSRIEAVCRAIVGVLDGQA